MSIAQSLSGGPIVPETSKVRRALGVAASCIAFFISAQCIYTSYFGAPESTIHRSVILLLCVIVMVILYPTRPGEGQSWSKARIWLLAWVMKKFSPVKIPFSSGRRSTANTFVDLPVTSSAKPRGYQGEIL